jgi:hypothetical protein
MRRALGVSCFVPAGGVAFLSVMFVVATIQEYGKDVIDVRTAVELIVLPAAVLAGLCWSGWRLLRSAGAGQPTLRGEVAVRKAAGAAVLAVAATAMTACLGGGQHRTTPAPSPSIRVAQDNGVSALPAKEIARRAGRAINNVPVHVRGSVSDGSSQTTTLDVVEGSGDEARCTVVEDGERADVVRVGGRVYVRASKRIWMSLDPPALRSAAAAGLAEGTYVRFAMPDPELNPGLLRLTKFLDVRRSLGDELTATQTATTDGTAVINGVPTIAVTPITPGLSPLPIGTIYVATVGEPYVLRWAGPGDVGNLDFSDYLAPVVVHVPSADSIVDLTDRKQD